MKLTDPTLLDTFRRPDPADLPTPFVEIDESRRMRNLRGMQARAAASGVALPHIKTHKSLAIARRFSEEHSFVRFTDMAPAIGSLVRIFPNHSCAVVAQFDTATLRQSDGRAVTLRVDARGRQT
ncbi:hypothetical protein ACIQUG_26285 [Ensifer sp. NPDC090286]|uniref:hypothetical protein n=1 Tax=Ensifer sp. NPDC090286 TaxID=3363991 RepID=UPI00383BEF64